jgi:hypothetical protein
MVERLMQELLHQIDSDYYRSARLLIVRAELEQLRRRRSAMADIDKRSKIPLGMSRLPEALRDARPIHQP